MSDLVRNERFSKLQLHNPLLGLDVFRVLPEAVIDKISFQAHKHQENDSAYCWNATDKSPPTASVGIMKASDSDGHIWKNHSQGIDTT